MSATSSDLAEGRRVVHGELFKCGLYPVIQDHIPPDASELRALLRNRIGDCDAFIALVGFVFGAEPKQDGERRSYTQIEYDIARELKKPIFVFMASRDFGAPDAIAQDAVDSALQLGHRQGLLDAGHRAESFSSETELRLLTARTVPAIQRLAWRLETYYLHAPSPPAQFVGRAEELRQIQECALRKVPAVIAVLGMGGQGKTTLVQHWLRSHPKSPFAAGLWCTADRGGFTFDMFLDEALGYLTQGAFDKRNCFSVRDRVRLLLGLLQKHPVLLVLDEVERWLKGWKAQSDRAAAESVGDRDGMPEGLDDFLTEASGLTHGSHLVLISRALPSALDQRAYALIPVRPENGPDAALAGLDPGAAVALLERLGVKGERAQIEEVAHRYGHHPLALTVLAGILSRRYGGRIDRLPRVDALDPHRALYLLLDESVRAVPGSIQTAPFLEVAALTFGSAPLRAIAAGLGDLVPPAATELEPLVDQAVTLSDWHLIHWSGDDESVELHPLVRAYFANRIETAHATEIHRRLGVFYADEPVPRDPVTLQDLLPRYLAIRHAMLAGDIDSSATLLFAPLTPHLTFLEWMSAWGHFSTGISLLESLSEAATGELRGDFLLARAALCHQMGRPEAASADIEQAISTFEHSENRASLASALNARGVIRRETAASSEALGDFERSLSLLDALPREAPGIERTRALVLVNRSGALWDLGGWSAALSGYDEAVPALDRLKDRRDSLACALATANRGALRSEQGGWEEARADLGRACTMLERMRDDGHSGVDLPLAQAWTAWGAAALEHSRLDSALGAFSGAVELLDRLVAEGRAESELALAIGLKGRGAALGLLGRHAEGLPMVNRAVTILERLAQEGGCRSGTLGYSLLDRARIRHHLGDPTGSAEDRARGLRLAREFRDRWDRESDAGCVYLRKSVEALAYLLPSNAAEARSLLGEVLAYTGGILGDGSASEALLTCARRALGDLGAMRSLLDEAGVDSSQVVGQLALVRP